MDEMFMRVQVHDSSAQRHPVGSRPFATRGILVWPNAEHRSYFEAELTDRPIYRA
jgi:hypothetical protein